MLSELSPKQINEIIQIVDLYVNQFIAGNLSPDFLTDQDKSVLKKNGIKVPANVSSKVTEAYMFGLIAKELANPETMSYEKFKKRLKVGKSIPLNFAEQRAVKSLNNFAYSQIKGLGNKINTKLGNIMIEVDQTQRAKYENQIKEVLRTGQINRETNKQIKSRLGHATQDWARDLDRVVDYFMHEAYDTGNADSIEKRLRSRGINDPWVYKKVLDMACSHCNRLYMIGGKPKLFKLSHLRKNGTNIGRKAKEWKPIIGATHPHCRCTLMEAESQQDPQWDEQKGKFVPNFTEAQKKLKKKISKKNWVKITE